MSADNANGPEFPDAKVILEGAKKLTFAEKECLRRILSFAARPYDLVRLERLKNHFAHLFRITPRAND